MIRIRYNKNIIIYTDKKTPYDLKNDIPILVLEEYYNGINIRISIVSPNVDIDDTNEMGGPTLHYVLEEDLYNYILDRVCFIGEQRIVGGVNASAGSNYMFGTLIDGEETQLQFAVINPYRPVDRDSVSESYDDIKFSATNFNLSIQGLIKSIIVKEEFSKIHDILTLVQTSNTHDIGYVRVIGDLNSNSHNINPEAKK